MKWPLLVLLPFCQSFGASTCSRVATVNSMEVLIDSGSSKKGEGLRYYLQKDPKALEFLEKYQQGARTKVENIVLGTSATGLILAGAIVRSKSQKVTFLASGLALAVVNFLSFKTSEANNERYLHQAIENYNKRNFPAIEWHGRRGGFVIENSWNF